MSTAARARYAYLIYAAQASLYGQIVQDTKDTARWLLAHGYEPVPGKPGFWRKQEAHP